MSDQINRVIAYYESTNFDYEHFWADRKAQAIHFGYHDPPNLSHRQALLKTNRQLAQAASIQPWERVLDAGCGYGGSSLWLAENIGCEVTGITVVPYQVDKACRLARKSPVGHKLEFLERDYARTGLPEGSFDVVWGLESVVHCDDKARFVREAYRLLQPGGRLAIAECMLREDPPLSADEKAEMQSWLDAWMMPDLLTPGQYVDYCNQAGFQRYQVDDWSAQVTPSLRKCWRQAGLARPFVGLLLRLRLIDAIRRDYTLANCSLYDHFRAGYWFYGVLVATKLEQQSRGQ